MTEKSSTPNSEAPAKRKFWLRAMWVSVALIVGPMILAAVGTVFGMFQTFVAISENGGTGLGTEVEGISTSMSLTMGALSVSFLALIFFLIALVRYLKLPPPSNSNLSQFHS